MTNSQIPGPCSRTASSAIIGATIFLMTQSVALAADVTFTDSEFVNADWVVQKIFDNTPGMDGTFAFQQDFGEGVPSPSQSITHTYTTDGTSSRGMITVHYRPGDTYDPSALGAITSIDISAALRGGYVMQMVLIQDGFLYFDDTVQFGSVSSFQTFSNPGIVESDFTCLNSLVFNPCPGNLDLSSTGGPITLGVFLNTSSNAPGTRFRSGHLDNWEVTIHAVDPPQPVDRLPALSIALDQKIQLNVTYPFDPNLDPGPCDVELSFVDKNGDPFLDAASVEIAKVVTLEAGETKKLRMSDDEAIGTSGDNRVLVRPQLAGAPPNPCAEVLASVELFDKSSKQTTVLAYPQHPVVLIEE